jgi:hypothetical protein
MTTGAARCHYALRPAERPSCQLTATVTYGGIALCSTCDLQRSTLGKGQARRQLPDTEPDPFPCSLKRADTSTTLTKSRRPP